MSRETLLDEAIAKAKEAEDGQLVEWLRMARGGESAAKWYTAKLNEARLDISKLMTDNAKLRELVRDMWRLIEDLDATPYVTERQGNNPAVTWLDEDWSVHESCEKRMRELGVDE